MTRRVRGRLGWAAGVAATLVSLLVGCASDPDHEPRPSDDEPRASDDEPRASDVDDAAGDDRIRGEVVAVSDVVGEPDAPVSEGWVLAVPEDRVEELWTASDRDAPRPESLPYWNPTLPAAIVDELDAVVVEVDDDGSFVLDVTPGPHLVCLLERPDPLLPFGCDLGTLEPDSPVRLTAGEGGIRLE
jgi:hypothetical protein